MPVSSPPPTDAGTPSRGRRLLAVAFLVAVAVGWPAAHRASAGVMETATPGGLTQIDAGTGTVVRTLRFGRTPTHVATAGGHVWATVHDRHGVWLVNQRTGAVRRIPGASRTAPISIAATRTGAYLVDGNHIRFIEPGHASPVASLSLADIPGDQAQVVTGPGGVWGSNSDFVFRLRRGRHSLSAPRRFRLHIPTRENEEQARNDLNGMAVGPRAVWVIGDVGDRRLWRIDVHTARITHTTALPFAPADVAVGLGGVWVTDQLGDHVYRIDPRTGGIVKAIAVGREPIGVALGSGSVWVTSAIDGTVSRIDPRTNTVAATIPVAGSPTRIAVGRGTAWAAAGGLPAPVTGTALKIGVVLECNAFRFQMQQTLAGAELPLIQRGAALAGPQPTDGLTGASVAGRPVKLLTQCDSYGDRVSEIAALSKLVEAEGADVVVGDNYSHDGIGLREYARHHPDTTFIATSFEQAQTLKHTVPNLFHFEVDNVQLFAGLGAYAYHTLGWRTAATVSDSDASSWSTVAGFDAEFCSLGGNISRAHRVWVDQHDGDLLGNHVPTRVDGVFLPGAIGGTDSFIPKWRKLHPPVGRHLVVGWSLLAPVPELRGVVGVSSDPFRSTPAWQHYLDAYAQAFPRTPDPGFANQAVYDGMEPLLEGLEQVGGDVSGNQSALMSALAGLRYHSPEGLIRLDARHQAIVPIYMAKVVRASHGQLVLKQIATYRNVEQTFGGYFTPTSPPLSMKQPPCVHGNPPPWAK